MSSTSTANKFSEMMKLFYLIEIMFMDLYLRVIDEENRLLPIRLLKVRTKCDSTIRESIQNFLCGDSDDSEYELVDTPLLSKAKQFKVNQFLRKYLYISQ